MRRLWRSLFAFGLLRAGRRRRGEGEDDSDGRIVPPGPSNPGSELGVAALLFLAALSAVGFIVVYSLKRFSVARELRLASQLPPAPGGEGERGRGCRRARSVTDRAGARSPGGEPDRDRCGAL